MELYGVAVAIVPTKSDPHVLELTCNPIAVSDTQLDTFRVLDHLAFKTIFDSQDTAAIQKTLIKTVNVVDQIVALQKLSLPHGMAYRPVALELGQASATPIAFNALAVQLFGERVVPRLTRKAAEAYLHTRTDRHSLSQQLL